eukprot:m.364268 g.364268  ORF g.364268 m.364268 type:complete len:221 (-) comp20808_c0_seq27:2754-3416(-)
MCVEKVYRNIWTENQGASSMDFDTTLDFSPDFYKYGTVVSLSQCCANSALVSTDRQRAVRFTFSLCLQNWGCYSCDSMSRVTVHNICWDNALRCIESLGYDVFHEYFDEKPPSMGDAISEQSHICTYLEQVKHLGTAWPGARVIRHVIDWSGSGDRKVGLARAGCNAAEFASMPQHGGGCEENNTRLAPFAELLNTIFTRINTASGPYQMVCAIATLIPA